MTGQTLQAAHALGSPLSKELIVVPNHKPSMLALAVLRAGLVGVAPASVAAPTSHDLARHASMRCAAKFELAQRQDMESFRDYDAVRFADVHHRDAVTVFSNGRVATGRDEIMKILRDHFTQKVGIWSWTELHRDVYRCKSATIIYDAVYEVPSEEYRSETITTVTYSFVRGRWLAVLDASAPRLLPPPADE